MTALIFLLAMILPLQPIQQNNWKEFSSKEGKFSVLLPNTPNNDSTDKELKFKLNIGPRVYGIVRTQEFQEGHTRRDTLDAMAKGFMTVSQGRLIDKKFITINNYPGVSIKFETDDPQGITEARYYLVGQYMYVLIAFTRTGNSEDNADKFLNSFRLLN
ncbi:MAG: hypothetical protein AB1489_32675 [Acidobacteriota bacterium]